MSDNTEKDNINNNSDTKGEVGNNTDKYLAMEQPGVKYTKDTDPTRLSDDKSVQKDNGTWNPEGGNNEYSEAFNQDANLLDDNIDLDEDQGQSISTEDDDFEETNERY